MISEQDIQQLISYIKGDLSDAEATLVKDKIETNSAFKEEYEFQRQVMFMAKMAYLDEMKAKLNAVDKSYENNNTGKWGKWALALVGGLVVSSLVIYLNNTDEKDDVKPVKKEATELIKKEIPIRIKEKVTISAGIVEKNDGIEEAKTVSPKITASIENKQIVENNLVSTDLDKPKEKRVNQINSSSIKTKDNSRNTTEYKSDEVTKKPITEVLCSKPVVKVKTTSSSFDVADGIINISSTIQLTYELSGLQTGFDKAATFYDLAPGNYNLSVIDSAKCEFEMGSYTVDVNPCANKKNYAFNVTYDKEWVVPGDKTSLIEVKIMSERGQLVYHAQNIQNENVTWNGITDKYEKVYSGLYKVFVTTKEQKQCIYNVIIEE